MPFYLRKSIKAGPFRFNFSKSGVGASVGVKGLRIGTGPRGHYVHAGRGGIYYRATIGRPGERPEVGTTPTPAAPRSLPDAVMENGVRMVEVDSGDVLAMRDESRADLVDEINAKRSTTSMALVLGLSLAGLGAILTMIIGPTGAPLPLLGVLGWAIGRWLDSYRRTCVLFYDLDEDATAAFEDAVRTFDALAACGGRWHVAAGGAVQDLTTWKRNAGATHIVRKQPTTLEYRLPRGVTSNVTPPALHVGRQVIHFMPDVALVDDGTRVGAVGYDDLTLRWQDSNFIEDGIVPRDAQVIGHTWKHPNKSGGPDRRFRDNRQIPICRYEAVHLTSRNGVNEIVEFSRTGLATGFAAALRKLARRTVQSPTALLADGTA